MRKPLALVAALLLTTSLAAGCGDDSSDDDATTSIEEGGAASPDDTGTTVEGDDSSSTSTTAAGGDTGGESGGTDPDSDFCDAARTFAADPTLPNLDFTKPEDIQHGVELLSGLRDAAPADLQDDLDIVIEGFQAIATALGEAGDDPTAQQEAVAGLQEQFEAVSAASTTVQTYTQEQCGIDVAGGGSTGTTTGG